MTFLNNCHLEIFEKMAFFGNFLKKKWQFFLHLNGNFLEAQFVIIVIQSDLLFTINLSHSISFYNNMELIVFNTCILQHVRKRTFSNILKKNVHSDNINRNIL